VATVAVIGDVAVFAPVIVVALVNVNGNDSVGLIDAVDQRYKCHLCSRLDRKGAGC